MNLSDHFSLEELGTTSCKDIPNIPSKEAIMCGMYTAQCMEAVRAILGNVPIRINSWYRSPALNKKIGGSKTSQHLIGEAVDFTCPTYGTPYEIAQKLSMHKQRLGIDQLILEPTWVHVSFVIPPRVPRLEVLTYISKNNYVPGVQLRKVK